MTIHTFTYLVVGSVVGTIIGNYLGYRLVCWLKNRGL